MNRNGATFRIVRGVASCAGLVLLLVGVPTILAALAGRPLPKTMPDPERIKAVLGSRAELPSGVVIKTVAVVGWIAWIEVAVAILAEIAGQFRHGTVTRLVLPGGRSAQALATHLVAGVMLLAGTRAPIPSVQPLPAVVAVSSTSPLSTVSPIPINDHANTHEYTVKPDDWLSTIARDELGDAHRYPEITKLNIGHRQPDGGALRDPDLIRPGWKLRLPQTAPSNVIRPLAPNARTAATAAEASTPAPCPTSIPTAPATAAEADPSSGAEVVARPAPIPLDPPRGGTPRPEPEPNTSPPAGTRGPRPVKAIPLVLPAALAGLAITRLAKLRANQQRHRHPGRTIPRPPDDLAEQETRARAIADTEAPAWVDAASRRLWTALEATPDVPGVIAVRAGSLGVELLLDRSSPVAPTGFVAADAGRTWRLDRAGDLDDLLAYVDGQSSALPGLLYVGDTPEGPLWLNLEHAGTLSVEGDRDGVEAFLSCASTHLATAPWSDALTVLLPAGDRRLAALDHIQVVAAERAVEEATRNATGRSGNRLAARVAPPGLEALAPTVILAGPGDLDAEQIGQVAAAARPESDVVFIGPGPIPEAVWRLELAADDVAILEPLHLRLTFRSDGATNGAVVDLIAHTTDPDDVLLPLSAPPLIEAEGHDPVAAPMRIRILGPVEVDWATSAPRRKATEIVTYLATRDHPVQGDRLRVDLWPAPTSGDEIADTTFRTNISRARSALGLDNEGRPHMPEAEHGAYRLGPGITSDWRRFQHLTALARNAPSGEAIEHYRDAMKLIRGAPFAEQPKGTYHWIHGDGLLFAIEAAVAEAAEHFAELLLDEGEHSLADWACRQALKVTRYRETLYQLRMKAAHQAGDHDALERIYRELRLAVRSLGEIEEPTPESVALYASLSQRTSKAGMARTA